jgi:glycosyltransferase involved in cell wall biosynthesis
MPSRIVYLPLETYGSRYTQYTACENGVVETCMKEAGVDFLSIRPDWNLKEIKHGQVLDVVARTNWGFAQISRLVDMIMNGAIDPKEDVIYLDDFWTPGFEQIMYAMSSKFGPDYRQHAKVFSFCHAQTFDVNDFTYRWAYWMRPLEKIWFDYQEGVFCAANQMIPLIADAGIPIIKDHRYKIQAIGHWFHREVMLAKAGVGNYPALLWPLRKKQVVFSARWDVEKNPNFFMDLMLKVLDERSDINFVICTGQPKLTSNNIKLLERINKLVEDRNPLVKILPHLSLNHYYNILRESKLQFNCALQDWISYTLLDATINGCAPLYPEFLSFPDALERNYNHLYKNMDLYDAKNKLYALIDSEEHVRVDWIYKKYIDTGKHAMRVMGFKV